MVQFETSLIGRYAECPSGPGQIVALAYDGSSQSFMAVLECEGGRLFTHPVEEVTVTQMKITYYPSQVTTTAEGTGGRPGGEGA